MAPSEGSPDSLCLQDRYAPKNACFGCGPSNEKGLQLKSHVRGDVVVCDWTPSKHHEAFDNMLNGGICGALLDCHSNWTAAYHLMKAAGELVPLCTVTADFHVKLKRPTPTNAPVHLEATLVEIKGSRAIIDCILKSGDHVTATCRGTFVAVQPGHPAYHRW